MIFVGIKCSECGVVGTTANFGEVSFSAAIYFQRRELKACGWCTGDRRDLCPNCVKLLPKEKRKVL
jgi:hypothetical protein